jgi:hypothetical protein
MAGMTDLAIRIATTMDATGLNKAEKSVKGLDKTIKKLGQTLGVTLGATAMAAYGKAAVKAFAEDEAAARRLSSAVDNLGLSFSKVQVATFISGLEQSAAIADDVLRPAFQSLLNITGSLTKSQELLNNAIQISRASGVDLATVTADLGKGYVGVTRGLMKYNTGLSRAELQTKSFNEILGIMLAKSAGAAQDYLTTTSYKLDVLRISSENAKESIGKGLVDAFAVLGGGSQASDAAKTIDNIAKGINAITMATAQAINGLRQLYKGLDFLTSFGGITGADGLLVRRFDQEPTVSTNRSGSPAGTALRLRQQRQAEAEARLRAKQLADLLKKQAASQKAITAEQKKQNSLKKSGTVFDLEQIQLVAALKGKLSEEEKVRVQAQLALLNGNEAVAKQLTNQILMAQDSTGNLAKFLAALPNARNPFEYLDAYLTGLAAKASALIGVNMNPSNGSWNGFSAGGNGTPGTSFNDVPDTNVVAGAFPRTQPGDFRRAEEASNLTGTIRLQITGEGDITNAIAKGLQNQSLSTGDSAYINRRTGGFAG